MPLLIVVVPTVIAAAVELGVVHPPAPFRNVVATFEHPKRPSTVATVTPPPSGVTGPVMSAELVALRISAAINVSVFFMVIPYGTRPTEA